MTREDAPNRAESRTATSATLANTSGAAPLEVMKPATPEAIWRAPQCRAIRVTTTRIIAGRFAKSTSESQRRTLTSSPAPIRLWIETAPVQPTWYSSAR